MSVVEEMRNLRNHFLAIGGFATIKGHLYFVQKDECLLYALNQKQNKVKVYTLGDGGTNWVETLEISEFKKQFPIPAKK